MSKGYLVNDYNSLTEKNIQDILSKIMDLIGLCIISNLSWAKDEDKKENLMNDVLIDQK